MAGRENMNIYQGKSVFNGIPKNTSEEAKNIDFGFGPSLPLSTGLISDGIMVW